MSGKNADPRRKHNGNYSNKSMAAFYVKVEVVDIATFLMRLLDTHLRCGSARSHDLLQCVRHGFVSCAGAFLLRRLLGRLDERAVRGLYDAAAGAHSLEDQVARYNTLFLQAADHGVTPSPSRSPYLSLLRVPSPCHKAQTLLTVPVLRPHRRYRARACPSQPLNATIVRRASSYHLWRRLGKVTAFKDGRFREHDWHCQCKSACALTLYHD